MLYPLFYGVRPVEHNISLQRAPLLPCIITDSNFNYYNEHFYDSGKTLRTFATFSRSFGRGSTTTVGISCIQSSGFPECKILVKPPMFLGRFDFIRKYQKYPCSMPTHCFISHGNTRMNILYSHSIVDGPLILRTKQCFPSTLLPTALSLGKKACTIMKIQNL